MTLFCCNSSRFLLPPAIEFATTGSNKKSPCGVVCHGWGGSSAARSGEGRPGRIPGRGRGADSGKRQRGSSPARGGRRRTRSGEGRPHANEIRRGAAARERYPVRGGRTRTTRRSSLAAAVEGARWSPGRRVVPAGAGALLYVRCARKRETGRIVPPVPRPQTFPIIKGFSGEDCGSRVLVLRDTCTKTFDYI